MGRVYLVFFLPSFGTAAFHGSLERLSFDISSGSLSLRGPFFGAGVYLVLLFRFFSKLLVTEFFFRF